MNRITRDNLLTALSFNEYINMQNLEKLSGLMSDSYLFIDSDGNKMTGKEINKAAWRQFFELYPSYRNIFEAVFRQDDQVIMLGFSACAEEKKLDGPAIWTARIKNGEVREWRVYIDTKETRQKLNIPVKI
jgi:hypothetical protein